MRREGRRPRTDRAARRSPGGMGRRRAAIEALGSEIDADVATSLWEHSLAAPEHGGPPAWLHGDLLPGNLLWRAGRLHAVIDWGGAAVGDPACDLMIAWALFEGESRSAFREAVGATEAEWALSAGDMRCRRP